MNDERLPDCWSSGRLEQLSKFIDYRGKTPKKKPEGHPLITAKNIRDGYIKKEPREYIAIEDYDEWMTRGIPREGDVVITTEAPMGNAALLNITEKFAIAQRVICMQFYITAMGRYAHYALRSPEFQKTLMLNSTGTTVSGIKAATLKGLLILVPPLAEQNVIADKLDTLLAQVENTKARLERIPKILKRFRQSVLAAAVSGRLTDKWRTENQAQAIWQRTHFSELLFKLRSGAADKPNEDPEGIPILRSSAVRPLEIDFTDIRYLSRLDQLKKDNYLKQGDLLFTRLSGSAEYVGNCAMVRGIDRQYQFPDRLFCARLKEPRYGRFLEYFCASQSFRDHILSSLKSSAGHQRITLDVIRTASVVLPPLEEQTEIVRQVDQLFAHADRIEQQVNNALARVNNLTQSILAKAFRGELTEQWRKDNPELISGENSAEALLEKVKKERAAGTMKPQRQRK